MARTIRNRASQSPAMKKRMLIGGCLSLALGLVLALWLPRRVPETQGSPAMLVAILLLWVVGGGLAYVGVVAILGALFARPPADDPTVPPSDR
jgi:MFS family permease